MQDKSQGQEMHHADIQPVPSLGLNMQQILNQPTVIIPLLARTLDETLVAMTELELRVSQLEALLPASARKQEF